MLYTTRPSNPVDGDICYEYDSMEIFFNGKWCDYALSKNAYDSVFPFDQKQERRLRSIRNIETLIERVYKYYFPDFCFNVA